MYIALLIKPNLNSTLLTKLLEQEGHTYELLEMTGYIKPLKKKPNLIIAYGGDGTVLCAMQHVRKNHCPLYGLEGGNFGFLHSGTLMTLKEDLKLFEVNKLPLQKKSLLEIVIDKKAYYALNDIVLSSKTAVHLIETEVKVNNEILAHYRSDGIIVATSTGSTAYSLSAGGSIIHPDVHAMILTPIASHSLAQRSIVLPPTTNIQLTTKDETILTIDGQFRIPAQECSVKTSKEWIEFVSPRDKGYITLLKEKFGWK